MVCYHKLGPYTYVISYFIKFFSETIEAQSISPSQSSSSESAVQVDRGPVDSVPENVPSHHQNKQPDDDDAEYETDLKNNQVAEFPPKILFGPSNMTVFLGDRIELRCHADGNPRPKIVWQSRRDGKLPKIGENFRVHKNGSLIFRFAEKRDESYYKCTAKSILGTVFSQLARITVEGKINLLIDKN